MTRRKPQPLSMVTENVSARADVMPARIRSTAFGITVRPKRDEDNAGEILKKTVYTIIKAALLIPGDGEPVKSAALVIENKLIAWVGPEHDVPSKYTDGAHRTFSIPFVMPGLWDVHTHFGGEAPTTLDGIDPSGDPRLEHPAVAGARLTKGCWEALQRGYTSLRDVAGYGCELSRAIDDGSIVGPNVYSSGACLSQTAGHGDMFDMPAGDMHLNTGLSSVHPGHWGSTQSLLVDGVDECRRAVRLQIRRGAKCIKIFASGGVLSLEDNPLYAQFSPEELDVIVQEATRQERVVAAHVHGKPGILAAVKAGVTTVEHVSFADEECIKLIKEKDTVYVATRTIVDLLLQGGGKGLTKYQWEKLQLCGTNHLNAYKMAIEAGVRIALGTDTAPGFNMAMELDYAVQAGLTPLEAIKAATANGPLSVGAMAPKTGQLKEGYEADILGLLHNPVEDVKILQEKKNVGWVWKGGRLFKGPGVGPWGEDPL
ncbi:amidohydrolase [Xylaria bambusicola]|uniref:amidohydrolase n=1 Tax=Xylaria bambusicola TaxID=326684 RepID=UPI002007A9AC|nr:amidohydrolase [Xylaria bambusicola]KAI0503257.1 amidohydrolase [Xylaria bambusicola]